MAKGRSSSDSVNKLTPQVKEQIVRDFENGMLLEEITSRHGLTHAEYVRRIIRKEKGDDVLPKTPTKRGKILSLGELYLTISISRQTKTFGRRR